MSAETCSLVKDWLLAEEQAAITMKGFSKPVRTYRVVGTFEDSPEDENIFDHEDVGVKMSIDGNRADKKRTKEALKRAFAQVDD